ncbi:type VI secretion system tip protein VgrG [Rhodobacterales bacterium]|nr:type VI secretion system tip protein VgrG [Rhodobacterales bacterium]
MAPGELKQTHRMAELTSVFGKDVISLVSFDCEEGLSEDFEISMDVFSQKEDLDFDKAIATNMTIALKTGNGDIRHFDGLLTDAKWVGVRDTYYLYKLTLRPWFWLLTKTSNCRIFKETAVPDIIKSVMGAHDFAVFDDKLTESYDTVEYCVQYRESDYDFCCRLMEEFGISYYFEHKMGQHKLILADAKSSFSLIKGQSSIPYIQIGGDSQQNTEQINHWIPGRRFRTGKFVVNDYDFKKPSASLVADRQSSSKYKAGKLENYDYPGRYIEPDKGSKFSKIRLEAEQAADNRIEASGEVPRLAPGALFSLKDHPHGKQNREYLVVRATHHVIAESFRSGAGEQGEAYSGTYDMLGSNIPFRTPAVTQKPRIPGAQTAVVTGQGEIDVDEYGQVMVEFYWDREGTQSRRVRVAQVWSGKNWGGIYIPRVGQEVIVQFLEGDPDQPIIVGTVYNGENMPPYALPGEKNKAGVKSDSTTGGGGYNEFVLDDTKGQELVGIHAEKDMETVIENDELLHVKNCRETKIDVDRKETVGRNTTEDIGSTWKVTAGSKIEFVCGASKITMTPASVKITSPTIEVKALGTLKAQGTKTDVIGSAMLTLKGGLVAIN